jgi:hypothetical protein
MEPLFGVSSFSAVLRFEFEPLTSIKHCGAKGVAICFLESISTRMLGDARADARNSKTPKSIKEWTRLAKTKLGIDPPQGDYYRVGVDPPRS